MFANSNSSFPARGTLNLFNFLKNKLNQWNTKRSDPSSISLTLTTWPFSSLSDSHSPQCYQKYNTGPLVQYFSVLVCIAYLLLAPPMKDSMLVPKSRYLLIFEYMYIFMWSRAQINNSSPWCILFGHVVDQSLHHHFL